MNAEAVIFVGCRAFAGVIVAVVLGGCTPDRLPVPKPTAPSTSVSSPRPVTCTGDAGRPLLTALLADLSAGRPTPVETYFTQPVRFVRWIDPLAYVTFLPGSGDDNVTLDVLQAHLDALVRAGHPRRSSASQTTATSRTAKTRRAAGSRSSYECDGERVGRWPMLSAAARSTAEAVS